MSDIRNGHIQGDLTISSSVNDTGTLYTNLLEETTTSSGISISNSSLNIGNRVNFLNDTSFKTIMRLYPSGSGNTFSITNNAGGIEALSKGGKGIFISETTGNVLISSTTDSIDDATGSLITNGGVLVGKTLNVKEDINGLDGIHTFTNTNSSQNVLDVKNTSTSGYGSIYFRNTSGSTKLDIGYGNSLVNSPLADVAYIQSKDGSELLFRADSSDSFKINTNGSIQFYSNIASTSTSSAALRIPGGVSISNNTDAVSSSNGGSFTTAGGLSVAKQVFFGSSLNITGISPPSAPSNGSVRLYNDSSDNLIKSKDSSGIVTTYQPSTTKGDLVIHDGGTQVRLPVGPDGYTLIADSNTSTGVKWEVSTSGGNGGKSKLRTLMSQTISTTAVDNSSGAYILMIYPLIDDGSSCCFFASKSVVSVNGVNVRLNTNPSLINAASIVATYPLYKGIKIRKDYSEGSGDYVCSSNEFYNRTNVSLSGTSWSLLDKPGTSGYLSISIYSYTGGPSASFILTKSSSTYNTSSLSRLASAPSQSGGVLEMRWLAGSYPEIRKNNSNNSGAYTTIRTLQDTSTSVDIILSGTSQSTVDVSIFNFYENKTFMMGVSSSVSGSPCAIFIVSKNSASRVGNISASRSPGVSTPELLQVSWGVNSLLKISKTGLGYDGTYRVSVSDIA